MLFVSEFKLARLYLDSGFSEIDTNGQLFSGENVWIVRLGEGFL